MALGFSSATATSILNAICNGTSYSVTEVWIKLHIGDPGGAGTAFPAGETDRIQASFAVAASGAVTSDTDTVWVGVSNAEDYTHFSAWTASTAGTFLFSGTVTANAVAASDTFTIPAGDLDASIPIAA